MYLYIYIYIYADTVHMHKWTQMSYVCTNDDDDDDVYFKIITTIGCHNIQS
jgi:hypothetical protein